jgi:DNA-directed RNA polymerase specialized sigma24 family protein
MSDFIETEIEATADGTSCYRSAATTDYRQALVDHIPDLRRYARSPLFNRDAAEELLQDCLERH